MTSSANLDPCNLPKDDRQARLEMIRREIMPHALGSQELVDGMAWEFGDDPELRRELERLVAFERECCGGLQWNLVERSDAPGVRLIVEGLDPARLRAALAPETESAPPRGGLFAIARAGGIGFAGAFLVFCILPIAAISVAGASVAAPLAGLDNPWLIGAASLVLGVAIWQFERRRARS